MLNCTPHRKNGNWIDILKYNLKYTESNNIDIIYIYVLILWLFHVNCQKQASVGQGKVTMPWKKRVDEAVVYLQRLKSICRRFEVQLKKFVTFSKTATSFTQLERCSNKAIENYWRVKYQVQEWACLMLTSRSCVNKAS